MNIIQLPENVLMIAETGGQNNMNVIAVRTGDTG